jgi:hypothetical protein
MRSTYWAAENPALSNAPGAHRPYSYSPPTAICSFFSSYAQFTLLPFPVLTFFHLILHSPLSNLHLFDASLNPAERDRAGNGISAL